VVLAIADQDVAVRHDGHALESFELRVAGAPGTEGLQEAAVRIEDLNAAVCGLVEPTKLPVNMHFPPFPLASHILFCTVLLMHVQISN